ncbi:DUF3283 family protein [Vibrio astriarenae]|jgi:hypothetical protein|uniref:DUF3283 family protein n=1 Tax=Vibrio agarivorans TaxID=153622 RepID=A0ABT7Y3E6_9VIBR|nr:DUF3283 family protein [Vibrio agarivorans]MDN2482506.1 DUF3283 family protein [Vibrio agarivorans]MDN3660848.1 DUF3283 family protein [Vibrio agarivorans]
MSHNLSLLDASAKNVIELDKQASFIVWKVKNGKGTFEEVQNQLDKLTDPAEQETFQASVMKYRQMMGL